jgi:hypothetical protein
MKILTITAAVVLTGCATQYPRTIDEMIPGHNPPAVFPPGIHNITSREEWDGSKGEFPPGRVLKSNRTIDYRGHGIGYSGHAQHHLHNRSH